MVCSAVLNCKQIHDTACIINISAIIMLFKEMTSPDHNNSVK